MNFIETSAEIDFCLPTKINSRKLAKSDLTSCNDYKVYKEKHCFEGRYAFQASFDFDIALKGRYRTCIQRYEQVVFKQGQLKDSYLTYGDEFIYSCNFNCLFLLQIRRCDNRECCQGEPLKNFKWLPFPSPDPDNPGHYKKFKEVFDNVRKVAKLEQVSSLLFSTKILRFSRNVTFRSILYIWQ